MRARPGTWTSWRSSCAAGWPGRRRRVACPRGASRKCSRSSRRAGPSGLRPGGISGGEKCPVHQRDAFGCIYLKQKVNKIWLEDGWNLNFNWDDTTDHSCPCRLASIFWRIVTTWLRPVSGQGNDCVVNHSSSSVYSPFLFSRRKPGETGPRWQGRFSRIGAPSMPTRAYVKEGAHANCPSVDRGCCGNRGCAERGGHHGHRSGTTQGEDC